MRYCKGRVSFATCFHCRIITPTKLYQLDTVVQPWLAWIVRKSRLFYRIMPGLGPGLASYFSMLFGIFHDCICDRLSSGMSSSRGSSAIQTVKWATPDKLKYIKFIHSFISALEQIKLTWESSIFNFHLSSERASRLGAVNIHRGAARGDLE